MELFLVVVPSTHQFLWVAFEAMGMPIWLFRATESVAEYARSAVGLMCLRGLLAPVLFHLLNILVPSLMIFLAWLCPAQECGHG
eukprot:5184536-Amphidinium_carterae.6